MTNQKTKRNTLNKCKTNTIFKQKNGLQNSAISRKTEEQILKVSGEVTHYCVLGYN